MKIIFLDIDGVLNVRRQGRDRFGSLFHAEFMGGLKHIIDNTGAKIVISSSWRFNGLAEMKEMWVHRNLPGEVIDITPFTAQYENGEGASFMDRCERGCEIREWLKSNPCDDYVIVDDDIDILPSQIDRFVKCSGSDGHKHTDGYGLTKERAILAVSILNKKHQN